LKPKLAECERKVKRIRHYGKNMTQRKTGNQAVSYSQKSVPQSQRIAAGASGEKKKTRTDKLKKGESLSSIKKKFREGDSNMKHLKNATNNRRREREGLHGTIPTTVRET